MPTKAKIKIEDDSELRTQLDAEYEHASQVELCRFALLLAEHILTLVRYENMDDPVIKNGYAINRKWQIGDARMHDVRQAGLEIHRKAKACEDIIVQTALRTVGQAVATGHMREHAMVASDYAIKVVNLLYPANINAVRDERQWQIECLKSAKSSR